MDIDIQVVGELLRSRVKEVQRDRGCAIVEDAERLGIMQEPVRK
ncbi:hypothetical protein FOXG_22874 [Fusarium oxysporum f. sp. lycopersici 4287]|uniref:Uncharacterized protein n=1 Tax=Fusarium oxysporum f. sp. lycopersici (strain 4287 / CBS 123668 / FGSC 9935 / NRRL 34936) TaxID=426428 RepID=A0A0J9WB35_FUSO4|nr:uncharacterized protein FOXG_22874 [Fusarium oxysporum f. sp. lycopersici 4287]KNB20589.1 hypothetical protein FOXG_22874 [Fusarium oxysporum f. sp. lycopersici 4287]